MKSKRSTTNTSLPQLQQDSIKESILKALGNRRNRSQEKPRREVDLETTPIDRGQIREALAAFMQIPAADVTKSVVDEAVRRIQAEAQERAECLSKHWNYLAEHLQSIHCVSVEEIAEYFEACDQVLVKLHQEASRPQPSPTRLRQLVLQYALDPRRPIEGNVQRFAIRQRDDIFEITEYPSFATRVDAIPYPCHRIRDVFAKSLLAIVVHDSPPIYRLLQQIEILLDGPPSEQESSVLPNVGMPSSLLQLNLDEPSITILGKTYVISAEEACFLKILTDADGLWLSSTKIAQKHGLLDRVRIDRLVKKLPSAVQNVVKSEPGKGYRLSLEALGTADPHLVHRPASPKA